MDSVSAISFQDVSQRFSTMEGSDIVALDRISFEVAQHEFVAVVGPSGCGKSTMLRIVAGLVRPTSGAVAVLGVPMERARENIGVVFQTPSLLPWLDVLANVTFPFRHKYNRVTPAEKERARALLDKVGLTNFTGKVPAELSGGMQQRVAIARALLMDPDILLMDEPFSALDALTREEMSLELLRLTESSRKTILFITHSISEALLLADKIIIMSARPGKVREIRSVQLKRPRSLATLREPLFQELSEYLRRALLDRQLQNY